MKIRSRFRLQQSPLHEAYKLAIPDDDVVQYLDPHDIARFPQATGNRDVFAAGGGIAGGVVVNQDDCCR